MADHNISTFASGFHGGGIRPHLFEVSGSIGAAAQSRESQSFHIKAASLPASSLGIIEVPYRGRKVKIPGDRTFAEWSITILCRSDMSLRNDFESWSNKINAHIANTSGDHQPMSNAAQTGSKAEASVFTQWGINQLDRAGAVVKDYTFYGVWPSEIGAVELDYETTDSVAEFPVTLQYTYWTTGGRNSSVGDMVHAPVQGAE
jgi:hypothetical protein